MMNKTFSLLSGFIFGLGLTVSSMTNPAKVIGFLDITDNWDPSLMFVMIGAIAISAPLFYLLRNKTKPLFDLNFEIPTIKNINKKLILGASIFGIGWGMVGFCPGPAIASLAMLKPVSIIFVLSMASGFYMSRLVKFNS